MNYDVFISYKNDSSGNIFSEKLADDLKAMGYSVYFNSHERKSGPFDERIRTAVANCKDFIAVVSRGYLEQLLHPDFGRDDWIREEILEARRHPSTVTITPIYLDGMCPPSTTCFAEGDDLAFFPSLDGVEMPGEGYAVSPLESLTLRLVSARDGQMAYRDLANGNESFVANEKLREALSLAQQGDYRMMLRVGSMLYFGFGMDASGDVRRDLPSAYYWLRRISEECEDQFFRDGANLLIALMYYQGEGTPDGQSFEKSFFYHSISMGDSFSAQQAAFMRRVGLGCDFDYNETERVYNQIIDQGDNGTRMGLGLFYEKYGRFAEAERTYRSMNPLTPEANYHLGKIYRDGSHVDPPMPDYERAASRFQAAREAGHVLSTLELGILYLCPTGTFRKDFERAQECFREAADAGNDDAQYLLGYMLEFGHVKKDVREAVRYFEMGARQGQIFCPVHLATLYQLPECRNYELAYRYCVIAASRGDARAEFMLGNFLLLGRGCDADVDKARRYYNLSLSHGYSLAKTMLDAIDELPQGASDGVPSWL